MKAILPLHYLMINGWLVSPLTSGKMAAPFEATPMVIYYGFNMGNFYKIHEQKGGVHQNLSYRILFIELPVICNGFLK